MENVEFVAALGDAIPTLHRGSLVVWGDIFGGRIDNVHRAIGVTEVAEDCVCVNFDQGETLRVWEPDGLTATEREFRIDRASRVRWEWFYYGRPRVPANLYFIEFEKCDEDVTASTNIDFYTPNFKPSTQHPAVEILSPPG